IAEFHILERQLVQVLQRLQTPAPPSHTDGCQCLDSGTAEAQESHPIPPRQKGKTMATSTLEPFTILASETTNADDGSCGCGCGCGVSVTPLALRQGAVEGGKGNTPHAQSG